MHAFVLPLFIPSQFLYFNYGFRIGDRWLGVTDEMVRAVSAALPRLAGLASLEALYDASANPTVDAHHAEVRLGVDVLLCRDRGVAHWHQLLDAWRVEREWELEVLERGRQLCATYERQGSAAALGLLAQRREGVRRLLT